LKYVCDIVVKRFTFAISSPDEFLHNYHSLVKKQKNYEPIRSLTTVSAVVTHNTSAWQTDGRTDGRTCHHGICRAMHMRCICAARCKDCIHRGIPQ